METPPPPTPNLGTDGSNGPKQSEKKPNKSLKRKRVTSILEQNLSTSEREARIEGLQQEIDILVKYFKEISSQKLEFEEVISSSSSSTPSSTLMNNVVACLLEESDLPYSKLVEEVYEKVKTRDGVTLASVRNSVLLVGQRCWFGVEKADADVLEDDSEKCLWCWETRDLKLIPKAQRGMVNIRRTCRKKIQERINAILAMISSLQMSDKVDMVKAAEKLVKVLNEADIRLLVENMMQKSGAEMAEKEAKLKEKGLIKELERNKRELEKEKKRMDREQQKEKLQNEKELKRLQDEAEKEEKRREKEEAEIKKQLKRQQEEAERDQRRKEKEEAELRKRLAVQKQATIMERFLKSKKNNSGSQDDSSFTKVETPDSSRKGDAVMHRAVTVLMDSALNQKNDVAVDDLLKLHCDGWNKLGRSIRYGSSRRWGMRHKPKTVLIKELKVQWPSSEIGVSGKVTAPNKTLVSSDDSGMEKAVDGWEEAVPDDRLCHNNAETCLPDMRLCNRIKKLLQFDKSHRPAYYGTLSVKSDVVGPRHPLKKDPNLDYDVESDEEWEEEDPGESLSDCDKDDEEETLDEGNSKSPDEDGSEDGFLVPDGYLSENEGVQVDSMEIDDMDEENIRSSPRYKEDVETEEFRTLFRQQKYINNLTEHALQKSQPLMISNLMHAKTTILTAEGLSGVPKLEQIILQALSVRPFLGGQPIEIIDQSTLEENQEVCQSQTKGSNTPSTPVNVMLENDLPKFVWSIQSCSSGINKVVESLQQNFPTVPKTQLRHKVREISDFVDNRWQVKKEILDKLGLSVSPGKGGGERPKGITAFFSKRCMPPSGGPIKNEETSPQPCRKLETKLCPEQSCTKKLL